MEPCWGVLEYRTGNSDATPVHVPLRQNVTVFGRSGDCNVVVRHQTASRRHFILTRPSPSCPPNGHFAVLKNLSRLGTFVLRAGQTVPVLLAGSSTSEAYGGGESCEVFCGDSVLFPGDLRRRERPGHDFLLKFTFLAAQPSSLPDVRRPPPLVPLTDSHPRDRDYRRPEREASADAPNTGNILARPRREPELIQIDDDVPPLDIDMELNRVMTPSPPETEPISASSNSSSSEGSGSNSNSVQSPTASNSVQTAEAAAANNSNNEARLSELENFVDQVTELYTCSICMELAYDPVCSTQCLHVFCGGCLSRWMFRTSGSRTDCPKCRTTIEIVMPSREWASIFSSVVKIRPANDRTDEERTRMDEANSFRGHGRFVVEDRINADLVAQIQSLSGSPGSSGSGSRARDPGVNILTGAGGGASRVGRTRHHHRNAGAYSNLVYMLAQRRRRGGAGTEDRTPS